MERGRFLSSPRLHPRSYPSLLEAPMTSSGSTAPRRDLSMLMPAEPDVTIVWGSPPVLQLPPNLGFEAMRTLLRTRLGPQKEEMKGVAMRVDIAASALQLFDLRRLGLFLKDEFAIDVIGLTCPPEALQRHAERELKLKIHLQMPEPPPPRVEIVRVEVPVPVVVPEPPPKVEVEPPPPTPVEVVVEELPPQGDRVLIVDYTLRSGTLVSFAGDVHVYGDVNPGAQVVAGGNVVVFGSLKGQAHAGNRQEGSFVMAFDMRPTLLRIGRLQLAGTRDPNQTGRFAPEIGYVSQGSIVIEPYRGRLPVKEVS